MAETTVPDGLRDVVTIFHEIRNYRYCSDGVRDPDKIAARRAGSCTGKHILLQQRLTDAGYSARIETVSGDLAAGIPVSDDMPAELREMIAAAGVDDFHHFVWLERDGDMLLLDATWPDSLLAYGFPVNADWQGTGDTVPAVKPGRFLGVNGDVIAFKQACLARLDAPMQERRRRFLDLLSHWMAHIPDDNA